MVEDNSSEEVAGVDRNATDRTMETTEAHPDQLAAFANMIHWDIKWWVSRGILSVNLSKRC